METHAIPAAALSNSNVIVLADFRPPPVPVWKRPGYIENQLSTWRETKRWKVLAGVHEAARTRVNELVEAGEGPHTAAYGAALADYKRACLAVVQYEGAKYRNLRSIIRCAAEMLDVADPAYNDCSGERFKKNGKVAALLSIIYTRAVSAKG